MKKFPLQSLSHRQVVDADGNVVMEFQSGAIGVDEATALEQFVVTAANAHDHLVAALVLAESQLHASWPVSIAMQAVTEALAVVGIVVRREPQAAASPKEFTSPEIYAIRDYLVRVDGTPTPVKTLDAAAKLYRDHIEKHDLGASNAPRCSISLDGRIYATVSYNGRIWEA